jgi:hypothetical protein
MMKRTLKQLAKALERLGSLEGELGTRPGRRSNTSPNQILHTFDSNLHTLLNEPAGAAQILTLKDGVRVQWHDDVHIHLYDVLREREEVTATHLDMVAMAKEHAKFPSVKAAVADVKLRIARLEHQLGKRSAPPASPARGRKPMPAEAREQRRKALTLGASLHGTAFESSGHRAALRDIQQLEALGSDEAIQELAGFEAQPSRYVARRNAAQDALGRLAAQRGMSTEQLVARTVPHELEPAARKRFEASLVLRWERMMVDGQRLALEDFLAHILEHPRVRPFAQRVVWAQFDRKDQPQVTFSALHAPQLLGVDGKKVKLDPKLPVGIPHPAELPEEARRAWRDRLTEDAVEQPFRQLERPALTLTRTELSKSQLTRHQGLWHGRMSEVLFQYGWWEFDADGDRDMTFALVSPRSTAYVEAKKQGDGSLKCIQVGRRGRQGVFSFEKGVTFGSLHPVLLSEILLAFETASRSPRQQNTPTEVLPQTGRYPYREVAKTGRSSCVVCRKPIAAGSTRIVILRMIDTGGFTAPRPAYLHPECREGCPELQGMKDPAAL